MKEDGSHLVSFTSENVAAIYELPKPEHIADEAYVKAFAAKNPDYNDYLQEWWHYDDARIQAELPPHMSSSRSP